MNYSKERDKSKLNSINKIRQKALIELYNKWYLHSNANSSPISIEEKNQDINNFNFTYQKILKLNNLS